MKKKGTSVLEESSKRHRRSSYGKNKNKKRHPHHPGYGKNQWGLHKKDIIFSETMVELLSGSFKQDYRWKTPVLQIRNIFLKDIYMKIKKSISSSGLFAFPALFVYDTAFAGWGNNSFGYSGGHMMGSGYMGWFMIFFWGLLLVSLILVIRWISNLSREKESGKITTPLDILNERLARGEIEIEEYKEKKLLLSGHDPVIL